MTPTNPTNRRAIRVAFARVPSMQGGSRNARH
jgi:hypothetical protein